jgi:hypothetical protein
LLVTAELDGSQVVRFIAQAIGDHEPAIRPAAGRNHRLGIFHRCAHGFFRKHVLAGLGAANGVLGVHAVGKDDVDYIDIGVRGDLVVVLVVVDVLLGNAVDPGKVVGLIRVTTHQPREARELRFGERRHHLADGEGAYADNSVSKWLRSAFVSNLLRRTRS